MTLRQWGLVWVTLTISRSMSVRGTPFVQTVYVAGLSVIEVGFAVNLDQFIFWESGSVFAVHKRAGLPVFPPHANPDGESVLSQISGVLTSQGQATGSSQPQWPVGFAGGIAHRLDNSTSGQLLVAKSLDSLMSLRSLFTEKRLLKRYRFVTAKPVRWTENVVEKRIAHDRRHKRRMVVERGSNTPHRGKWLNAATEFSLVREHSNGLSVWEATMRTGVMHQIRLHAASVGLALAGDRLYGGGRVLEGIPKHVDFMLHHLGATAEGFQPDLCLIPSWWDQVLD